MDDTVVFLTEVIKYLPREGSANLVEDIVDRKADDSLGQLSESIETGLLLPMKGVAERPAFCA